VIERERDKWSDKSLEVLTEMAADLMGGGLLDMLYLSSAASNTTGQYCGEDIP
jgi:hypothetical protein